MGRRVKGKFLELFLVKGTEERFGASYSINDFSIMGEARKMVRNTRKVAVKNELIQRGILPIGRPKFFVHGPSGTVDPLNQGWTLGWKQEFGKWANFLQA